MKKFYLFFAFLFLILGWTIKAHAEDVVYLKDGSVIHGSITEEVPGVSVKIETADGNVFVYKVRQISKITHSAAAAPEASDEEQPESDTTVVVTRRHRFNLVNDFKSDPNASFSIGAIFGGVGFMSSGTINTINNAIDSYYGYGSDYELTPLLYSGNFGIGWFTNHIGLKWTFTYGVNLTSYYSGYSSYYYDDIYVYEYGSELEADFSLDDVQTSKSRPNARRVFSVYVPVMVGYWNVTLLENYYGYYLSGNCTDFGTGLGLRFINDDHWLFDLQCVYRWSGNETALTYDSYKYSISTGKYLDADVSGLAMNLDIGYSF